MANRVIAAKAKRAAETRREAAHVEYTKPAYIAQSGVKAELSAIVASCNHVPVVKLPAGKYRQIMPSGKGGARMHLSCGGNGERRWISALAG